MKFLPLSSPRIEGRAWRYVKDCLDTEWVSSVGRYVEEFEAAVARHTGARHAVAGINGTSCLHLALRCLGIGPRDAVVVPALTFIATAYAVSYCGAGCVFVDCDSRRFNMDLDALEDLLSNRCRRRRGLRTPDGRLVRAVIPVHVLGYPLDMTRLSRIARDHSLALIEDAAESIGSAWRDRHTGTFGLAGVLSFNGNKIITCGGGGMLLTRDRLLARRAKSLTQQAKTPGPEYIHDEVGYNYRLTNVQAALGLSQLELLSRFLRKREVISRWYRAALPGIRVEPVPAHVRWNRWLLSAQAADAGEKARLLRRLQKKGCQARPLWLPVPLQKPYRVAAGRFPQARRAYDTVINLPSSTCLERPDVARVAEALRGSRIERLLL